LPTESYASDGRNVLIDYYVYRESIEVSSFCGQYLRTCLKADWRAWVGALISVLAALRSFKVCSSSEFDPYRSKVAEEMLLCEDRSAQHMPSIEDRKLLMRVPQQDCEKLLSLALPTDCFDIQAHMFR
jgi:hypothetical protein